MGASSYTSPYYGLLVRESEHVVTFSVENIGTGEAITGLRASAYRTTSLARKMGEKDLRGYEHEAREAIREYIER